MARERTRPLPLDEPADLAGEWWLPDSPDQTAYGRLVYDPSEGLTLHLASGGLIIDHNAPAAWIHGLTVRGRFVTLRNCVVLDWSLHAPGGIESRVYVEQAFIGMHAASETELSMLSLSARMRSLSEWLEVSGLTVSTFGQQPRSSHYSQPSAVPLVSVSGCRLSASFDLSGRATPLTTPYEVTMEQRAWLDITPRRGARRFLELWNLLELFSELLAFTSGIDSAFVEVVGQARVKTRTFGPAGRVYATTEPIWVLFARPQTRDATQVSERMLFRHADVAARNGLPLLRWFRRAESLRPVVRTCLAGLPTRTLDPESRFLTSVQALEGYERYVTPGGKRGLTTRLDNLVDLLPAAVRRTVPADFTASASVTRDYFSHRIPQLEQRAATSDRLFPLMNATRLLFDLVVLRELGFPLRQIANWTLSENQRLVAQVQRGFLSL